MMKKFASILLAVLFVIMLVGCEKKQTEFETIYPTLTVKGEVLEINGNEITVGKMTVYMNEPKLVPKESKKNSTILLGLGEADENTKLPEIPQDKTVKFVIGESTAISKNGVSASKDEISVGSIVTARFDNDSLVAEYVNINQ